MDGGALGDGWMWWETRVLVSVDEGGGGGGGSAVKSSFGSFYLPPVDQVAILTYFLRSAKGFWSSRRFPSSHDDDDEGAFRPGEQRVQVDGLRGWADICSLFRVSCLFSFCRNRATESKRKKSPLKQDLKGRDKDRDTERRKERKKQN